MSASKISALMNEPNASCAKRVMIQADPFFQASDAANEITLWPAKWIADQQAIQLESRVLGFRRCFRLQKAQQFLVHVSADERYELFLDGQRIGRGAERGDPRHWFFESHQLNLDAGEHTLVARVWWLGPERSPVAQMTVRCGLVIAAQGVEPELLNTGVAAWECKRLGGWEWLPWEMAWGTGCRVRVVGSQTDWDFQSGQGTGWTSAVALESASSYLGFGRHASCNWWLRPAILPAMLEEPTHSGSVRMVLKSEASTLLVMDAAQNLAGEQPAWQELIENKKSLTIPARTTRQILVDWNDYVCAYPQLVVSGGRGAKIKLNWAESLYKPHPTGEHWHFFSQPKGNRNEIQGKIFAGVGDEFLPDGGKNRLFETLWWRAGRYAQIVITTGDEALTLERLTLLRTHYPYEFVTKFSASDAELAPIVPLALRTLSACSHETFMDCPYYEQLMYIGDGRLEALTAYVSCVDDRLPRKAIEIFDVSRIANGLTQSRYPSRGFQLIPPFSLWWVAMVHDYAFWRDDLEFVRSRMVGVRAVLEYFRSLVGPDGLMRSGDGWYFLDWVNGWEHGVPPDGHCGQSNATFQWQLVLALRQAAELEKLCNEPLLAQRWQETATKISQATVAAFWDESRGLLADDLSHQHFSEHTQCLAMLVEGVTRERGARMTDVMLKSRDIAQTTIYFQHYFFEAMASQGRMDQVLEKMNLWKQLPRLGLLTTVEMPEPARSDCHAWGAHPLFHFHATILGVRPAVAGFKQVRIQPNLGSLQWARGSMAHPRGTIEVDVARSGATLTGRVKLPAGVTGSFITLDGKTLELKSGETKIG